MNTVTIDNIPVYDAILSSEGTGMLRISLVDEPAVLKNFQHFKNDAPLQLYKVQDEEKRLVRGVVMRADFPIYRRDKELGEYYIIYKAETIRQMAEKYLAENRQNLVNLMHEAGTEVEGVQMVQYFLKDTAAGVAPEGFADIADGSLFAEFHVTNDDVWDAVKDGTYQGFSLEGLFDLKPERNADYVQEVVNSLDGKFSKDTKQDNKMSKLNRIKAALAKALQAFASITTDKGILNWDGDDDLKAGDRVYLLDEAGERSDVPDGDYTTEDGKVIVVADGVVAEIRDAAAEVAPEEPAEEVEAASVETDNGTLHWDTGDDLKEGDEVYFVDSEGNRADVPDGDYRTTDGKIITVAEGKVAAITDDSAEVAPEVEARRTEAMAKIQKFEESYDEKYRKIAEAVAAVREGDFYILEAGDDFAVVNSWDEDINDHYYRYAIAWNEDGSAVASDPVEVKKIWVPLDFVSPFEEGAGEEVEALRAENAELKAQVETLKKEPAAEPAHEVVKTSTKLAKSGSKGLSRVEYLMSLGE